MAHSISLLGEELVGLISWGDVHWCVGEDFNVIRFLSENLMDSSFTLEMREFSEYIFRLILLIYLFGGEGFFYVVQQLDLVPFGQVFGFFFLGVSLS